MNTNRLRLATQTPPTLEEIQQAALLSELKPLLKITRGRHALIPVDGVGTLEVTRRSASQYRAAHTDFHLRSSNGDTLAYGDINRKDQRVSIYRDKDTRTQTTVIGGRRTQVYITENHQEKIPLEPHAHTTIMERDGIRLTEQTSESVFVTH